MKNIKKIKIYFLFAALLPAFGAFAWPQPKGHGFFKLDFSMIRARQFYGMDGKIIDINGSGTLLSNYTTSFYGEYGLTSRLTAIGYIPVAVRNTVNEGVGAITGEVLQPGLENTSFGDVDLGLKYGLFKKGRWVLDATLMLGLPTGDYKDESLLYTGDGEFNQFARVDWGYGGNRWYATGFLGINNRSKGFSEEFRYSAEAGYWLVSGKLLATARVMGVESFNNGDPMGSGNGLFSNNVEFLSPQLALTYEIKQRWGVTAQFAGAFKGQNALASPAVSVGIYTKLKKS
jgi:protein XagA